MFINNSSKETLDKLSILLTLNTFNYPVKKEELVNFIITNDILKYFETHELIISLIENDLIKEIIENNIIYYETTENGRVSIEFFKDRIPIDLQNTIVDLVKLIRKPVKIHQESTAHYEEINPTLFEVYLELIENNRSIMKITLNVPSEKNAKMIIENWNRNSEFYYGDIINVLTK